MSAFFTAADGLPQTSSKIRGIAAHFARVDSLRDHTDTRPASDLSFKAFASEPPKSPAPRIATLS